MEPDCKDDGNVLFVLQTAGIDITCISGALLSGFQIDETFTN